MTKDNQRLRIHTTLAVEVCRLLSQSSDILLNCIPVISRYLAWNIYRGLPTKKRLTFPRPAFVSSSARPVCITRHSLLRMYEKGQGHLLLLERPPVIGAKYCIFSICVSVPKEHHASFYMMHDDQDWTVNIISNRITRGLEACLHSVNILLNLWLLGISKSIYSSVIIQIYYRHRILHHVLEAELGWLTCKESIGPLDLWGEMREREWERERERQREKIKCFVWVKL